MKLSDISNLSLIKTINSSIELFKNKIYNSRDFVEKYIGLMIHRSGFYGRMIGDEVVALELIETTFNEPDDVVLVIEGVINLPKAPVNDGAGGIVFTGNGKLTIIDPDTGDESPGYSGGGAGSIIIDDTQNSDFAPVNAGNTLFRIDSPTDVTVTINEDSCPVGQCIEFTQVGAGQILLAFGDIAWEIPPSISTKSEDTGATISVFHAAPGIYNIYGQVE